MGSGEEIGQLISRKLNGTAYLSALHVRILHQEDVGICGVFGGYNVQERKRLEDFWFP